MLRILAFFLVVLAAALGFSWLADNPGTVTFVWQGQQVETSLMVFLIALAVLIFAVLVVVFLVRAFFKTPGAIGGWWGKRRRDRGYSALSSGIIAAGAGDAVLARRMTKRSAKLLDTRKEPLIRFLDAQTAMIEGDHARARSVFEQMERDPETRLLAMRGLFLEAERVGDEGAARYYAERAVRIAPHVPWAGGAVLESKSLAGDWDGALEILEAQKNTRLIDRDESKRTRAVLLTAKAMQLADADPKGAKRAGIEAHELAPDLVPAALVAAQALFRLGDLRRGAKILEKSWTYSPHPEIAEAYVDARPGDSVEDRLRRARKLHDLKPNHVESAMCLARAALDAGDIDLARKSAMEALEAEPRESVYLLLADIDEEGGEAGRVREWLSRAIRAPRDPAWTADGMVSEHWAPVSPVSGRIDAFRWKVPVERIRNGDAPVIEAEPGENARTIEAAPAAGTSAAPVNVGAATHEAKPAAAPEKGAATVGAGEPAASTVSLQTAPVDTAEVAGSQRTNGAGVPVSTTAAAKPQTGQGEVAEKAFGRTSEERKAARFG
ncbi:heme biosynthesis protein HemY [Jiella sp. M17.18]|uniref:heme biosynthesis protein HemY n=1 Tax=Jiella sp. M17.18 TaxID=3234247 RepID=UPI0034DF44BB